MTKHEVDQYAPHQAMSISQPRAHPLRTLAVFGTPVAFAPPDPSTWCLGQAAPISGSAP
jgi:hypothetical protein